MKLRFWVLAGTCLVVACGGRAMTIEDDPSPASGGSGGLVGSGGADGGGGAPSTSVGGGGAPSGDGGSDPLGGASNSGGEGSEGAGGAFDPIPRSCNSSDGSGCEASELCLDDTDLCFPDSSSGCGGTCATKLAPSSCEGGAPECSGAITCLESPVECPYGQVHSVIDDCWGPCVPANCCECDSESDCFSVELTCDRQAGSCFALEAPEPRCGQPFVSGDCSDERSYIAFIDGSCQERLAATCNSEPTGNLFNTLEECLWRCEGLPTQGECPEGRVAERVCLECGPVGGCGSYALVCAKTCEDEDDCEGWFSCLDGLCGANGCH